LEEPNSTRSNGLVTVTLVRFHRLVTVNVPLSGVFPFREASFKVVETMTSPTALDGLRRMAAPPWGQLLFPNTSGRAPNMVMWRSTDPNPDDEGPSMTERQLSPGSPPEAPSVPPAGGGPQGVLELQRAYYQGEIPRAAALASAELVYGFTPAEAEKLFPVVAPVQPVRSWWGRAAAGLGALAGANAGGMFCTQLVRPGGVLEPGWKGFALFVGLVGGAIVGALVGPLVRAGMISFWRRHAETT
jgi:hypothetical protein